MTREFESANQGQGTKELQKTSDTSANQQTIKRQEGAGSTEIRYCACCGEANEKSAVFCASCGQPLASMGCPNCGSPIDADADFCEVCKNYVKRGICSFCGAALEENDSYCPECGSPRGGIVCPVCRTLNSFSFCKKCGTPLTEEAQALYKELVKNPIMQQASNVALDLDKLENFIPFECVEDIEVDKKNQDLRTRVLELLAKDKGDFNPMIPKKETNRMTRDELKGLVDFKKKQLAELLNQLEAKAQISPAKARNYAMATKPFGVRVGWKCNYKNALHSSPCGCAKPHLGGRWVVLGENEKVKED